MRSACQIVSTYSSYHIVVCCSVLCCSVLQCAVCCGVCCVAAYYSVLHLYVFLQTLCVGPLSLSLIHTHTHMHTHTHQMHMHLHIHTHTHTHTHKNRALVQQFLGGEAEAESENPDHFNAHAREHTPQPLNRESLGESLLQHIHQ